MIPSTRRAPHGSLRWSRTARSLIVLLAGLMPLGACGGGALATTSTTPAAPVEPGRILVRAPIVRVSLRVAESFPPQYFADVTSALPNGCAQFARFAVRREGNTVFVDVFNSMPGEEIACTMIYGERDTAVPLGSDFVPGTTYLLDVNGTRQSFVAG